MLVRIQLHGEEENRKGEKKRKEEDGRENTLVLCVFNWTFLNCFINAFFRNILNIQDFVCYEMSFISLKRVFFILPIHLSIKYYLNNNMK